MARNEVLQTQLACKVINLASQAVNSRKRKRTRNDSSLKPILAGTSHAREQFYTPEQSPRKTQSMTAAGSLDQGSCMLPVSTDYKRKIDREFEVLKDLSHVRVRCDQREDC